MIDPNHTMRLHAQADERISTMNAELTQVKQQLSASEAKLAEARLLLAGWRATYEEGRHPNSPINSTRAFLAALGEPNG